MEWWNGFFFSLILFGVSGFSGMGIVERWNGGMDARVIFWCMLAITASE